MLTILPLELSRHIAESYTLLALIVFRWSALQLAMSNSYYFMLPSYIIPVAGESLTHISEQPHAGGSREGASPCLCLSALWISLAHGVYIYIGKSFVSSCAWERHVHDMWIITTKHEKDVKKYKLKYNVIYATSNATGV
ncbi:hypothetical protein J6590_093926 [Homalodisca vitripennis]|nr:hypothetical protein J6590_093926 [Homalodisca vitripennis]